MMSEEQFIHPTCPFCSAGDCFSSLLGGTSSCEILINQFQAQLDAMKSAEKCIAYAELCMLAQRDFRHQANAFPLG